MCGGEAVNAPGVAPVSFIPLRLSWGLVPLGRRKTRARFGLRPGVTLANLLGPRVAQPASGDFHSHQAPPQQSPFPAPQRVTMYQPGFQPPYQFAPGFKSMVSEISYTEAPPNPADAESSDYESDVDDDPSAGPAANLARRAKASRQWRMYREFNGTLTNAAIPDHASKFKEWKNILRADICQVSKAGQKTFN